MAKMDCRAIYKIARNDGLFCRVVFAAIFGKIFAIFLAIFAQIRAAFLAQFFAADALVELISCLPALLHLHVKPAHKNKAQPRHKNPQNRA